MRVIAGKYKGRKLRTPADNSIRPTTDKVKEALFSILTEYTGGSRVLDLFSGTGGLGIEALSRGARECVFGDSSRDSIKLIKENIAHCGAEKEAVVIPGDFRKLLMNVRGDFDIIILDPPYDRGLMEPCFEIIRERGLLAEDGLIVAEHRKEESLPDEICGFSRLKERRYGIVVLSIYC